MTQAWGQSLTADDRRWIDVRWHWLSAQFGSNFDREIILTEPEYFPDEYHYNKASVKKYLSHVCAYMDVNPEQVQLLFYDDRPDEVVRDRSRYTAGKYVESRNHFQIWIESKQIADPLSLVATLAHELAHVRLLGEKRISPDTLDHELLTDLLTVYLGMGVFTANSTIREDYWLVGDQSGWRMSRQGYLSMPMLGYALALLAASRGESNPAWLRYIRKDIRSHFKQSMKLIQYPEEPWLGKRISDEQFLLQYAESLSKELPALQQTLGDRGQRTCCYCDAEIGDDRNVCTECLQSIVANSRELRAKSKEERSQYEFAKQHQKHFVWILFVGILVMMCWMVYEGLFPGR